MPPRDYFVMRACYVLVDYLLVYRIHSGLEDFPCRTTLFMTATLSSTTVA